MKINVYKGSDNKLHFVDSEGADSVLPFSSGATLLESGSLSATTGENTYTISFSDTYTNPTFFVDFTVTGYSALISECYPVLNGNVTSLGGDVNGWKIRTGLKVPLTINWYLFAEKPTI